MSASTALLIVIILWIAIGLAAAVIMGRRGHAPFSWMVAGAVLGPLVVPLMFATVRARQPMSKATPDQSSSNGAIRRGIDVLFGFDGSEESKGALVTAAALFGPHLGRLTIATVVEFEASRSELGQVEVRLADVALLAAGLLDRRPETITLVGRPDEALIRLARENHFDVLVIAPRGRGATRALFGSVASRLARAPHIPIAIMPPARRRTGERTSFKAPGIPGSAG
jgi:nucleotide-binding universal stress UspA family protein